MTVTVGRTSTSNFSFVDNTLCHQFQGFVTYWLQIRLTNSSQGKKILYLAGFVETLLTVCVVHVVCFLVFFSFCKVKERQFASLLSLHSPERTNHFRHGVEGTGTVNRGHKINSIPFLWNWAFLGWSFHPIWRYKNKFPNLVESKIGAPGWLSQ